MNIFKDFYLEIELTSENAKIPTRAYSSDAGFDVYSPYDVKIFPGRDKDFELDFKVKFPKGFALIFKEKSGRSIKNKLSIGACVVDSGYEGIVRCHLFNHSKDEPVYIKKGEKVAQFIIVPVWYGNITEVKQINSESERGEGGFGSTGI